MALELYKPEEATRSRGALAIAAGALLLYGVISLFESLGMGFWQQDLTNRLLGDEFPISPRAILCGILMIVFTVGIYVLCNNRKVVEFLISTESEMGKVSWPTQQEVFYNSIVVIVTVIVLAVYLGVIDFALAAFKNKIPWDTFWNGVFGGGA
ncbi:MAG: preprotein translocase subunit SecE [Planctomycetota bacterium]